MAKMIEIGETEKSPAGTIRLARASETPLDTYLRAQALAQTVFPREDGTDAVRRLHDLSHTQALLLAEQAIRRPPSTGHEAKDVAAWERGQERHLGLEEE